MLYDNHVRRQGAPLTLMAGILFRIAGSLQCSAHSRVAGKRTGLNLPGFAIKMYLGVMLFKLPYIDLFLAAAIAFSVQFSHPGRYWIGSIQAYQMKGTR
jgi:hypothetical protein